MSATADLLDFAHAQHRLPAAVHEDTVRLLADTLAVGAAGATAPGADGVWQAALAWGTDDASRPVGGGHRLPAASAAFVSAFRIHCLEWDAVHEPAVVHALSVVVAAIAAAADRRGDCDPEDILAAVAVGVDIASGLGIAADSPLSFFRPATAGCIGAALAVARIDRLPRATFDDVLGLAYSACAGTMQAHVEGSIALPLQVAGAARAAISAVDLAKAKLTGPHDALEGPFGYFTLFDKGTLSRYTNDLASVWRISEVSTKPYPSGRASHATLGTLRTIMAEYALTAGDIQAVDMTVPQLIARLVGRPFKADMTPAYARLCLPLLSALMTVDGRIDPRRFTTATFTDPDIARLAVRLTIHIDGNPDPNALSPQTICVTRTDGSVIERAIPDTLGSPNAPLSTADADAKRALARELARPDADPRLFDDPLSYIAVPEAR